MTCSTSYCLETAYGSMECMYVCMYVCGWYEAASVCVCVCVHARCRLNVSGNVLVCVLPRYYEWVIGIPFSFLWGWIVNVLSLYMCYHLGFFGLVFIPSFSHAVVCLARRWETLLLCLWLLRGTSVCVVQTVYIYDNYQQSCGFWSSGYAENALNMGE